MHRKYRKMYKIMPDQLTLSSYLPFIGVVVVTAVAGDVALTSAFLRTASLFQQRFLA